VNYKILTMDNKEIWVECIGKKISYAGSPAMLLSVHDITERKQIETALIESDKRSRLILQSANDAIFIHEISTENPGRFIEVNDQACQMLGYTREELLGMGIPEIDVPEQNEHVPEILEKLFSTGKAVFQTDFLTKDGRRIPIEDSNRLINLDGKPVVLCIARDLSEQKRTEQVLQAANRKLNLLSRITRHDINNQLLTLHGYVEMLRNKIPDPALEESFTRIMDAGDRISRMIEFTREYEKIGVSAPVWQDCRTLVDTATRESWPGKVTVKNDIPAGTSVYVDPLITKVLYNLMDNAARYGGENPTLRFSVQNCNGNQIIVCEDNGEGVPADRKERIFDRGYGKNTGLGLALSREILDITGITIHEAGEPGKGARFEMTVPKGHFRSISP
jgi:PAS domain S-box-containing protein